MKITDRGTVFKSETGTNRQSCTFPHIAITESGRWLCSWRCAYRKGEDEGQHVVVAFSDDEGSHWSAPEAPFSPPERQGKSGLFRAVGLTPLGGERLLAVLCWVDHSNPSLPFFNEETEGLIDTRIMLARSEDLGRSWSEPEFIDTTPFDCPAPITGPVVVLPNGEWLCQFELNKHYHDISPWIHSSVLLFSNDEGQTWPRHALVSRDPANRIFYWDQRVQVMADGSILDLFWTYNTTDATYLNSHARSSADNGLTWTELWDTGVPGQPAQAVQLPDGRIAMVYVDRTHAPTIKCRTSSDRGRTWPEETEINIYETESSQTQTKGDMADAWSEMGAFSAGLPATAAHPDGGFVVVYYAGQETDKTDVEWARVE
jgi:hypothetical protein